MKNKIISIITFSSFIFAVCLFISFRTGKLQNTLFADEQTQISLEKNKVKPITNTENNKINDSIKNDEKIKISMLGKTYETKLSNMTIHEYPSKNGKTIQYISMKIENFDNDPKVLKEIVEPSIYFGSSKSLPIFSKAEIEASKKEYIINGKKHQLSIYGMHVYPGKEPNILDLSFSLTEPIQLSDAQLKKVKDRTRKLDELRKAKKSKTN